MTKSIPITVFTGFLGSGKTTLLNKIIKGNPAVRFGLIINEFGEIGIDAKILDNPQEEIVEMSDGCMCCVVRSDLVLAITKMAETGKVDYILIETSGLAEPMPIIQTFSALNPEICYLDGLLTVVDSVNYKDFSTQYQTVTDQIKMGDVIILNKTEDLNPEQLDDLTSKIKELNELASILVNHFQTPPSLFIETNSWNVEKLLELEKESKPHTHNHSSHKTHDDNSQHSHHHEHNDVEEIVWKSHKILDPNKMDFWLNNKFPSNVIRAKGILRLSSPASKEGSSSFVFQMVGANKTLVPLNQYTTKKIENSSLVFIGKNLNEDSIISELNSALG